MRRAVHVCTKVERHSRLVPIIARDAAGTRDALPGSALSELSLADAVDFTAGELRISAVCS